MKLLIADEHKHELTAGKVKAVLDQSDRSLSHCRNTALHVTCAAAIKLPVTNLCVERITCPPL